ncbi:HAD family phosphatase [Paenalkalicoccus suaedae]|uniref:HAD family phosphatase n=1 Tax=Paenalkalicoccus suaedae TaxID=2592382 RepID=A0A859FAY3_9BACI|nr:HAD family hydrolase [Paenalkalicoccus suaedae]QKS70157.1 HAD family phosphatase [Paenalkalicoccus suaedae]
MMNIKAVFIDMDGTLLTKDNQISEANKCAIDRLRARGVNVFLATGRHLDITLPYHQELELKTPMICLNGAAVYDWFSLDPLFLRTMAVKPQLHEALLMCNQRNMMIHAEDGLYCATNDSIVKEWTRESQREPRFVGNLKNVSPEKVLKYSIRSDSYITLDPALYGQDCEFIRWDDGFELVRKNVSKWSAIEYLLNKYGIKRAEAMAFGDGPNDVEMLKQCGTGVAMGNANNVLKSVADFVTLDHEKDGLSFFLEKNILQTVTA